MGGRGPGSPPPPRAFRLESAWGAAAELTDHGATLMRLRVPDRDGRPGDVVLGLDRPGDYLEPHPHLGCTVGRVANRIAGARFALDGREVRLPANDGEHHLHGGPGGFGRRRWEAEPLREKDAVGVRFHRESPDGEEGYPGCVRAEVSFRLTAAGELRIDFVARTDRPTLVSLSHHAYWNLHDGGASPVLDHRLRLWASRYTPVDAAGIPSGAIVPVERTPFDFREPRRVGDHIDALRDGRGGWDHDFVLDGVAGALRPAARLADPASGRVLELWTTLPGVQLYSGNGLDGSLRGHGGAAYGRRHGVCLEPQLLPDAPHHAAFPSMRLDPGALWRHVAVYRFSLDDGPLPGVRAAETGGDAR